MTRLLKIIHIPWYDQFQVGPVFFTELQMYRLTESSPYCGVLFWASQAERHLVPLYLREIWVQLNNLFQLQSFKRGSLSTVYFCHQGPHFAHVHIKNDFIFVLFIAEMSSATPISVATWFSMSITHINVQNSHLHRVIWSWHSSTDSST